MGGFFAGLGSALAGAGAQAGPYRDKENEHKFKAWETTKSGILSQLNQALTVSRDDNTRSELFKLIGDATKAMPGDDISKLVERHNRIMTLHPQVDKMMEPPPVQTGPGPAPAGSVPGSPVVQSQPSAAPSAPDYSGILGGGSSGGMSPSAPSSQSAPAASTQALPPDIAAQPTSSPVQGAPLGGINVSAPAPKGSMSPTFDMLQSKQWLFPNDIALYSPMIQHELSGAQHAIDAETAMALKLAEERAKVHNVSAGGSLVGPDGKLLFEAPRAPQSVPATSRLIGPDGKVIVGTDPKETGPTTAFRAALLAFKQAHGDRDPNQQELNQIQSGLRGGEAPVVVMKDGQAVYVPRSQAIGQAAPRTTFDLTGMPSVAGQQGVSMTRPPALAEGTQASLAGIKTTLNQARIVRDLLNRPEYRTFGPLLGQVKLAEIEKLGGKGATKAQIKLADELKRLVASRAFAEGGKNLTATELGLINPVNPQMSDTIEAAIQKTDDTLRFYDDFYKTRIGVMSPSQRGQLGEPIQMIPGAGTGGPPPKNATEYLRSIGH